MANKNQSSPDDEVKLSGNTEFVTQKGNAILSGATITAINSKLGITRRATTDENGRYEIKRMRKGTWQISVAAPGYQTIDELKIKLTTNDKQDFVLQPGFSVAGSVYHITDKHRISGAVVVAENSGGKRKTAVSDDDGDYKLDALAEDKWALYALHEAHQPSKKTEINLASDTKGIEFKLHDVKGTTDIEQGKKFLNRMIAALLLLVFVYVFSHHFHQPSPKAEYSELQRTVSESLKLINSKTLDQTHRSRLDSLLKKIQDDNENEDSGVSGYLSQKKSNSLLEVRNTLSKISNTLSEDKTDDTAAKLTNLKNKANDLLRSLDKDLKKSVSHLSYFWSDIPMSLVEILFWATAGVLVNIIMSTGYYLRMGRFYREGIAMHLSHIVAVPLMVLVVMLLLSVFSLEFVFQGKTSLKLDLSNPIMLVSIAFLLASKPWAIRSFVKQKADKILGQDNNEEGK